MCNIKIIYLVIYLTLFVFNCEIYAKRIRKQKDVKENIGTTTVHPDVVTYSSYGYSDPGASAGDGFVPSSPSYANYLSSFQHETTTRLYAPAFPTAMDTTGPEGDHNYDTRTHDVQNFPETSDQNEAGIVQYPQSSYNTMDITDFSNPVKGHLTNLYPFDVNNDHSSMPVYGAKISVKNRDINIFNITDTEFQTLPPTSHSEQSPSYQSNKNEQDYSMMNTQGYRNIYNYAPTYPPTSVNEMEQKPSQNGVTFQRVVDFTKNPISQPMEIDNQYSQIINTPPDYYKDSQNKDGFYSNVNKYIKENKNVKNSDYINNENEEIHKPVAQYHSTHSYKKAHDYSNSNSKPIHVNPEPSHYKDNMKKFIMPYENNADYIKWKHQSLKGENSYDADINNFNQINQKPQSPYGFNIVQSENMVDLTDDYYPKKIYNYEKKQHFKSTSENNKINDFESSSMDSIPRTKYSVNTYDQNVTPTSTSYWGNSHKPHYTAFPQHSNYKTTKQREEDFDEEVVHIPRKKQNKYKYLNYRDDKPLNEFKMNTKYKKIKNVQAVDEWNKDMSNRFKYEVDLLSLRNQDTSHPFYLPTFNLNKDMEDLKHHSNSYDIDKLKQMYMKSKKYKHWNQYDQEGLGSDMQAVHIPIPKPYPVEVPHPVIVPVPQPYPVKVPVPKPIAVPVVRELTVSIEKPVPYPVFKNVPYPVEKLVPVPVEKTVSVPVERPYPIHLPQVRPVFHHSRPSYDENDAGESHIDPHEDFFSSYPEKYENSGRTKIFIAPKKHKSTRSNSRRRPPISYNARNRRRWPERLRNASAFQQPSRHQRPSRHLQSYSQHDREPEYLNHQNKGRLRIWTSEDE